MINYFNDCDSSAMLKDVADVRYKKKETLIKQSSHSSNFLFLRSGLVKIFTERRNDKNIVLQIITPNNFIGLSQLFESHYNYSAMAYKDSEVCIIPKESFYGLLQLSEKFRTYIMTEQSRLTNFYIEKISSLGTKQMHGRLADVILYLNRPDFAKISLFESITRKDIAEMSGMSSESAIRLLTEFRNDGLINTDGKRIEINNRELLQRLSEIG